MTIKVMVLKVLDDKSDVDGNQNGRNSGVKSGNVDANVGRISHDELIRTSLLTLATLGTMIPITLLMPILLK